METAKTVDVTYKSSFNRQTVAAVVNSLIEHILLASGCIPCLLAQLSQRRPDEARAPSRRLRSGQKKQVEKLATLLVPALHELSATIQDCPWIQCIYLACGASLALPKRIWKLDFADLNVDETAATAADVLSAAQRKAVRSLVSCSEDLFVSESYHYSVCFTAPEHAAAKLAAELEHFCPKPKMTGVFDGITACCSSPHDVAMPAYAASRKKRKAPKVAVIKLTNAVDTAIKAEHPCHASQVLFQSRCKFKAVSGLET